MSNKVRGIDCKFFMLKLTSGSGLHTAVPDNATAPVAANYDEVKTVNNVEQSLAGTEFAFETREQADDEFVTIGQTRDVTVSIYEDVTDPFYVRLAKASRGIGGKIVGIAYANALLTATPLLGTSGNFTVSQVDFSESKKEGKLVKFKLKPNTFVGDFFVAGS